MGTVVFRADGSTHLGMGHIMRCLAIADDLKSRGTKSTFVLKGSSADAADVAREKGFNVVTLSPQLDTAAEAAGIARELDGKSDRLVVTDICHKEALKKPEQLIDLHGRLAERFAVVSFAGAEIIDVAAAVIVDPIERSLEKKPALTRGQIFLGGARYFTCRKEFKAAAGKKRKIELEARRVLIVIGGGDEDGLTLKSLDALANGQKEMEIRVVIGPCFSDALKSGIDRSSKQFRSPVSLLAHDANLAEQMAWADLVVTGDGLTKYESALTGTPTVALGRIPQDAALNREFEKKGTCVFIEDAARVPGATLGARIREILLDAGVREQMSKRGQELVDGRGFERIMEKVAAYV
jgi:spore coat polysaccharide biosynthesis predicted glycosyltransferase SpsG